MFNVLQVNFHKRLRFSVVRHCIVLSELPRQGKCVSSKERYLNVFFGLHLWEMHQFL